MFFFGAQCVGAGPNFGFVPRPTFGALCWWRDSHDWALVQDFFGGLEKSTRSRTLGEQEEEKRRREKGEEEEQQHVGSFEQHLGC